MKPRCINCHFLCKTIVNDRGVESRLTWNENERKTGYIKESYVAEYAELVWSTGFDPHIDMKREIYRDRGKDCFRLLNSIAACCLKGLVSFANERTGPNVPIASTLR